MKAAFIAAILIPMFLAPAAATQSTSATKPASPAVANAKGCNRALLQTYSMTGLDVPAIDKIEMCPSITRTCCLKQDQQILFTNFVHGGEYQAVVDHYTKVVGAYYGLIEKLVEVQEFAHGVKNNIVKKIANCKLLAERIGNFEISQVREQIRQNLNKLQDFFQTTYSGFYCTICNFDNHKYFDMTTQTVFFSEKFCRDIVENTLHTLLLFHVDIVKLVNLVTKFISSCDFTGTFNLDAVSPSNYTFSVINDNMQNLQACRDNRNKREWFSYCKDICTNFNIATFSEYFQPNVKLIASYTAYLTKELATQTQARASRPLLGVLSTSTGKIRILQESEKVKPIFRPGVDAKCDLMKFKSDFLAEGISLYDEGKNSLINESTYNSVKTFLQILSSQQNNANTNPGQNPAQTAKPATQTAAAGTTPKNRRLNSAFIGHAITALVALLLAR
jgi:hypothetical protein